MSGREHGSVGGGVEALRIWLLGGFKVSIGSRTIEKGAWRLKKAAALIKLLSLAEGHRLHREQVMEALWPKLGRKAAANNLRRTLHAARRTLDPTGVSHTVASEDEQLVLCPDGDLWVDVEAFEQAAATARHSRVPAAYRVALDLYAGELLPADRYEGWAEDKRGELRRLYLDLLVELAKACEERGDFGRAVEALRMAVAKEPILEEAHAGLMRLYALLGQEGEALAQYERLQEALFKQLGTGPSTATNRLRDELASGEFPSALSPPTGAPQAEVPQESSGHNLPAPRTSFVGREREMLEVKRQLAMTRLLTLTGTGGSGKTRLALEVARSLVGAYPDGVWLVELAPLSEGTLVPQVVARALGVKERPGQPLTDTLAEVLRTKRALLVLDNCEHLVEAVAPLVDVLLDACPGVRVLATSREGLGIAGEMKQLVPSLSVPGPRQRPRVEELERYESVRLFVDRAQYHNPAFVLTPQDVQSVAQICERLDGIPLAIELAAARVGLSVEQIANRLDDSLRLLTTGSRTASARHRTLRGALDWSYDLLSEPERRLFGRLSVFAGGWTLEAAEVVGAGDGIEEGEVFDLLLRLVDKSLVIAEATGQGGVRYRMLEPVRQYAHKRLEESGEAEDVRWRHAAFLTELAEEAEPELRRPEQAKWLERLEAEHDNVRAVLSWSLGSGGDPGLGLRLASALPRFWLVRGHNGEGVRWLEDALTKGEAELVSIERARALHGLGDFLKERNEFERAEQCLEQALTIYEELGDRALASYVLGTMGFAAMRQGDGVRATAHFERAIAAGRESGNLEALSDALSGLGWIAASGGDYARTRRLQEDGLAVMREQEHVSPFVVGALANVAFFEVTQGNHQRAITLMEEGLALSRQLDYKVGLWVSLFNLGLATTLNGDPMRGEALLKEALMIVRELEIDRDTTENLAGLAVAAGALGQHARAARLWGADEAIRESTGVRWISEERKLYEPLRDAARSRTDEAVWETAFAEGKAMGLAEAVAYALSEEEIVGHVVPAALEEQSAGSQPPDLTRREREVAQMVAKGFTNRRVAQELVISEHTVENHVARILKKLNLHSREQIASRLTQH